MDVPPGWVLLVAGQFGFPVRAPQSPGGVVLALDEVNLFELLDRHLADTAVPDLQSAVQMIVKAGIDLSAAGELTGAFHHARASLWFANRLRDSIGIEVVTANLLAVREACRDVLERALGPAKNDWAVVDGCATPEALQHKLTALQALMRTWAAAVLPTVLSIAGGMTEDPATALRTGHAAYRLAVIASDAAEAERALTRLIALGKSSGEWDEPLVAATEALLEINLSDILTPSDNDAKPAALYLELVDHIAQLKNHDGFVQAGFRAFRHLDGLRLRCTTGGGAFGHIMSFRVSPVAQRVGRELVALVQSHGQDELAFTLAEQLRGRALTEWMGRTHPHFLQLPVEFRAAINPFTGSLNAGVPAELNEMRTLVAQTGRPVLAYLAHHTGMVAWVLRPDGEIVGREIGDPGPLIARAARILPYFRSLEGLVLADLEELDRALSALHDHMLPPALLEALGTEKRIAILADGAAEVVPFAALRGPGGKYLLEEREIVMWPSFSGWKMLREAAAMSANPERRALVLWKSVFPEPVVVKIGGTETPCSLPTLEGVRDEAAAVAARLGVAPTPEGGATAAMLMAARTTGVVHIASHGILVADDPERSFVILADGPLTAQQLYRDDGGVRSGLVVLSACQTALGGAHPDSVIGLTNAFLVSGADAVMSTLWQIPDRAVVPLMETFYRELGDTSCSIPAALQRAQLELLRDPSPVLRSPISWGAFRVIGERNPFSA